MPLPCASTAFAAKPLPLDCVATAFAAKPPCVATAFAAKTPPLPWFQVIGTKLRGYMTDMKKIAVSE